CSHRSLSAAVQQVRQICATRKNPPRVFESAMSLASVLDRLDRAKQLRPGNWIAACPCCQSRRGRPISVRELDDGRVLLFAFCGCQTGNVLAVLGLSLSDLFPERSTWNTNTPHKYNTRIPARDVLAMLDHEITVACLILADVLDERRVTEQQFDRLAQ